MQDIKKTKAWLNRGYCIEREIKLLEAEKQAVWDRLTSFSGQNGERVSSSGGNTTENNMISYATYNEKIGARLKELYTVKEEILSVISKAESPVFRQLLEMRYISFKTWDEISAELMYDIRHVHRLHYKALKKAGEALNLST